MAAMLVSKHILWNMVCTASVDCSGIPERENTNGKVNKLLLVAYLREKISGKVDKCREMHAERHAKPRAASSLFPVWVSLRRGT